MMRNAVVGEGPNGNLKWDQWTPMCMLRTIFSDYGVKFNLRALAAQEESNHTFVRDVGNCLANVFCRLQAAAMRERLALDDAASLMDWVVLHIQWDETRMNVKLQDVAPASFEVMSCHGMIHWQSEDGKVSSEELVFPPAVLEKNNADTMFAALSRAIRLDIVKLMRAGLLSCLSPSIDSVSANTLVCKYLNTLLPDFCLLLPTYCLQHQMSLCLASASRLMGFVGPLFCTARILSDGNRLLDIEKAVRKVLQDKLERITVGRPDAAHGDKSLALLEMCYPPAAARDNDGDDDGGEGTKGVAAERDRFYMTAAEGAEMLLMFSGDWGSETIVHHCAGAGCCKDRAESVDRATRAFMAPLRKRIGIPSLNRWLSVLPVVAVMALMRNVHGLLLTAARQVFTAAARAIVRQDASATAARAEGKGSENDYRKEQQVRAQKMLRFLGDPLAGARMLVWLAVAAPAHVVHFTLFKRGTLYGWAGEGDSALVQMCRLRTSLISRILSQFSRALDPSDSAYYGIWSALLHLWGPMRSWPLENLREADAVLHALAGSIWRRFFVRLRSYPWRLCKLVDPAASREEKEAEAAALLQAADADATGARSRLGAHSIRFHAAATLLLCDPDSFAFPGSRGPRGGRRERKSRRQVESDSSGGGLGRPGARLLPRRGFLSALEEYDL